MKISEWGKGLISWLIRLSLIKQKTRWHITRYYMYQHLQRITQEWQREGKVLSIGSSKEFCEILSFHHAQIVEANYPDCTMLALPFSDQEFDFVVSDQVLEHIEGNPQSAIDETYRVLKPGGIVIHTTCLINPIHNHPGDFWRFTPQGLKLLCQKFSKILEADGWGNKYVWLLDFFGLRYEPIPEASWHPLHKMAMHNRGDWPITTWIIAQK